jgi:RNA polymerase sigma-70 factor (ECF subfamily)
MSVQPIPAHTARVRGSEFSPCAGAAAGSEDRPVAYEQFAELFVGFEPRLYAFIRTLVPNRADAEEVLQESAAVLWRKFPEYRPGSDFASWAFTVARFQVLAFRKRRRRNVLSFSQEFVDDVACEAAQQAGQAAVLREVLESCLAKLKPRDQELFRRRQEPGASVKLLAGEAGRPASTVYNSLNRIRRLLFECVQKSMEGAKPNV